jgi:hypothetical protein
MESDPAPSKRRRGADLEGLARTAGREAAREVLIVLGVDIADPRSIADWHDRQSFLRSQMLTPRDTGRSIRGAFWKFAVPAFCIATWEMLKAKFGAK